jgi:hypothetical protein
MAAAELSKVTFGSKFAFRDLRAIIVSRISFLFSDVYEFQGDRSDPIREPPATGSIRPECCHEY